MNEEVQEIIGNLAQINAAQAIDLAIARARVSQLERELAQKTSSVAE